MTTASMSWIRTFPIWKPILRGEIAQRSGVATIAAGEGDEGVDYEFVTYRRIEA